MPTSCVRCLMCFGKQFNTCVTNCEGSTGNGTGPDVAWRRACQLPASEVVLIPNICPARSKVSGPGHGALLLDHLLAHIAQASRTGNGNRLGLLRTADGTDACLVLPNARRFAWRSAKSRRRSCLRSQAPNFSMGFRSGERAGTSHSRTPQAAYAARLSGARKKPSLSQRTYHGP